MTREQALEAALAWFSRHSKSIQADVASAHSNRRSVASSWMREDDAEMRVDLGKAFEAANHALALPGEPAGGVDTGRRHPRADEGVGKVIELHHDGLSRPLENPRLRVLSLGAGVQSTTLALMAARGEIEAPDCAIFADTGDEPAAVYEHLAWLMSPGILPFPVHIAKCSRTLKTALQAGDEDGARIPWHVGDGGMGGRNCTRNWKIRPIRRKVRELLGVGVRGGVARNSVEQWIGISTDEVMRLKPSGCAFIHNRHPLIEARMSRQDCYRWLEDRQYRRPPKSRCKYCPYQANADWRALSEVPDEWEEVVELDGWLREPAQVIRFHGEVYLHSSRRPLSEIDLTAPDVGMLFQGECEGMCGV